MNKTSLFAHWRQDIPASVVVFLVALPLCLGIAMASGAPLFSGLTAGIVGGLVVGTLSKSPLSVSGPAAGLTVIVLDAIQTLPTFEAFLLAVCLAGVLQIIFGFIRAGVIGDFIPASVINGMLAAIGLILIMKQLPHAFGYDGDYMGDHAFLQTDGQNTLSTLWYVLNNHFSLGAILISVTSLVFMFWWEKRQVKMTSWLRYVPGPLLVVVFGVCASEFFKAMMPLMVLQPEQMVAVPVTESAMQLINELRFPDFAHIGNKAVWVVAITLALVASIESLLSIEAVDKLDPYRRITPTNRELLAQGVGNTISGLIGGLPVTSVIVRSSANISAGGRTKLSAIFHAVLLLICVLAIPKLLNSIPLSALAAILIAVGYKLTKPAIFMQKYRKGLRHFIPFVVTITAILFTDLLVGIAIGVATGVLFILLQNFRSAVILVEDENHYLLRLKKDIFFIHKYELKKTLREIPDNASVLLDVSKIGFVDRDNADMINQFIDAARMRGIKVTLKSNRDAAINNFFKVHHYATA